MRLRTLGGLSLEGSDFTRPKPLLLLAHLAVEGPQRRRHLAELFWPHASDRMKSLTVALARLRSGAAGAVGADRDSAWTTVPSDAEGFLGHLDRGAREEALALYGGPFLDGLHLRRWSAELEEWVHRTRELLATRAYHAHLGLAEAEAADGRFERAAERAERALTLPATLPEPEDLRRLHALMLAGGSARAADARREADELGVRLAASPEEARGWLRRSGGAGARASRYGLPVHGTAFVGRRAELAAAETFLASRSERLLTLVGPAGAGKSRLAVQIARRQWEEGRFPHGIHLIPLETMASADAVAPAIAEAAGAARAPDEDALRRAIERLGDSEILLILDGFEHLTGAATLLPDLLRGCPRLHLLVTSRERLNLEEERILPLPGLPCPTGAGPPPAEALRSDAVRLFVHRARRADPGFVLHEGDVDGVLRICRLLEGLPLGLELAAAWAGVMPPGEIAAEIARDLDFLTSRTRDRPERHRSLRSAFEHSWRLLSAREQDVLSRLSVFHGGFRRDAAREVAGANIPVLASLVDKSLLRVDRTGRYDRDPLLYQYTREKLEERPEERRRAEERHGRTTLGMLSGWTEELVGGRQQEALAAIGEELANVRAAWRRAAAHGWTDVLWEGCRPLQLFYIQRGGMAREGARVFSEAAAHLDPRDARHRPVHARLRIAEAWFWYVLGESEAGEGAAREGVRGLRSHLRDAGARVGDEERSALLRALASGANTLGNIARRQGDAERAERAFLEALDLAHEQGNAAQVAIFTNNLALLEKDRGRYREAERLYDEALALNRRRGNDRSTVRNLVNLGGVKVLAGDPAGGERVLQEALELAREIGYDAIEPHLLLNLGHACRELGRLEEARSRFERAMASSEKVGDRLFEADVLRSLARVAAERGELARARRHYARSLELAWRSGSPAIVRDALIGMAELRRREGDVAAAARLLSMVRGDGAVPAEVARRIEALLASLRTDLPADELAEALARGGAVPLEEVIEEVVREADSG